MIKKFRDGNCFQSFIDRTISVVSIPQNIENTTHYFITVSASSLNANLYIFARLSEIGQENNITEMPEGEIWLLLEVPSIVRSGDGSLELVVRKSYHSTLANTFEKIFPGSNLDFDYDPRKQDSFKKRAEKMVEECQWLLADFYAGALADWRGWRYRL